MSNELSDKQVMLETPVFPVSPEDKAHATAVMTATAKRVSGEEKLSDVLAMLGLVDESE